MTRAEEVLSFWFGSRDEGASQKRARLWFGGAPEVDREIRERFGADLEAARRGELDAWADSPRGRLALILLLDQFSRNVYRGTPDAFAQDKAAQKLTVEGIELGADADYSPIEKLFFSLPLEHAEDLALQERSVKYAEGWVAHLPAEQKGFADIALREVRSHRDTIVRFGRFPMRNEALGRASTPEEAEYVRELENARAPTSV
jgi:uncharacterized protein (DUF924 family)